jgi:hypothetical protein
MDDYTGVAALSGCSPTLPLMGKIVFPTDNLSLTTCNLQGTLWIPHRIQYYNVTLSQAIQSRADTLAMGQIRRMVVLLDIPHPLQGLLRRERLLGQHGGDEQQRLPAGPCWRPFFTRARARTKK